MAGNDLLKSGFVKKLAAVAAAIFIVGVLALLLNPAMQETPQYKIGEYAKIVSSERPRAFLQAFAQEVQSIPSNAGDVALTIYQNNLSLVNETRDISLEKGLNLVNFSDVSKLIDTSSVLFQDTMFPDTFVAEQNYDFDTASRQSLLEKFVGETITVEVADGTQSKTYTGKLLSYTDGIVLETSDGIVSLQNVSTVSFGKNEGLLTKPTLVLKVFAESAGNRKVNVSYLTGGLGWSANYVAKLNKDETAMEFSGNVTVSNNTGMDYRNAALTLLAGQVNVQSRNAYPVPMMAESKAVDAVAGGSAPSFSDASNFEYHTYTLDQKTDILDKETKQISLLRAKSVPVQKEFVFDNSTPYYYSNSNSDGANTVKVMVNFKNDEASNLGTVLPSGTVRLYRGDGLGATFLGEDSITHTPKDEERKLFIGYASDIVAKKTTVNQQNTSSCNIMSYKVDIRNHKSEKVAVKVDESAGGNSQITAANFDYVKKDAYTVEFTVPVDADGSAALEYTVKSCWG